MFMAGARVKKGLSYGATDELGVVGRGAACISTFCTTLLAQMAN